MSRKKYIALCITSLAIGGMYYILFKNNTVLENIICNYFDIIPLKSKMPKIESSFLQYHFNDMLWAFSLQCGLCAIFAPTATKQKTLISLSVILLGILWETAQHFGITNGTGDLLDVLSYLCGSAFSLIITFYKGDKI